MGFDNKKIFILCSVITTTLIYTRKLVRGECAYLYIVANYRNKETGKVRQRT